MQQIGATEWQSCAFGSIIQWKELREIFASSLCWNFKLQERCRKLFFYQIQLSSILKWLMHYLSRPLVVQENDKDHCGFYFMPYETVRRYTMQFQQFFVNSFDIDWDPRSYLSNKDKNPGFNFTLLEKSTRYQNANNFDGPFPNVHVVHT